MWVGRGGVGRRAGTVSHVALAVVCYVPLLLTA
jgi:hypothetical protein